MLDSLIVPLFVTADLPPQAELAEFGELLADTARALGHEGASYDAFLAGKVFWLDRPVLPEQRPQAETESRFAAMLGHLAASGAIDAAMIARYGDVGVAPAVFAIRDRDVRERTPGTAIYVDTRHAAPDLVTVARPYL
jgi:hypothetical protein